MEFIRTSAYAEEQRLFFCGNERDRPTGALASSEFRRLSRDRALLS